MCLPRGVGPTLPSPQRRSENTFSSIFRAKLSLASLRRLEQLLVVLLAGQDVSLELSPVGHGEDLGLLAVLQELLKVSLEAAQHLLVLPWQRGLNLGVRESHTVTTEHNKLILSNYTCTRKYFPAHWTKCKYGYNVHMGLR